MQAAVSATHVAGRLGMGFDTSKLGECAYSVATAVDASGLYSPVLVHSPLLTPAKHALALSWSLH